MYLSHKDRDFLVYSFQSAPLPAGGGVGGGVSFEGLGVGLKRDHGNSHATSAVSNQLAPPGSCQAFESPANTRTFE